MPRGPKGQKRPADVIGNAELPSISGQPFRRLNFLGIPDPLGTLCEKGAERRNRSLAGRGMNGEVRPFAVIRTRILHRLTH
jgi:hypothetical protein